MWRSWFAISVAACGAARPAPAVSNHSAATPFAQAELAVRDGGDVRLYSLAGGHLTDVMKVHLADHVDGSTLAMTSHELGWVDRDHFVASIGDTVLLVSAAGTQPLAVPPADSLVAPKPPGDGIEEGGGVFGVTIAHGEVWWSKCAWGFPADGFQCTVYVNVRLWPTPAKKIGDPILGGGDVQSWSDDPPAGFKATTAEGYKSVTCTPPRGPATRLQSNDENDGVVDQPHWVSLQPPRMLITYGGFGMTVFFTRWSLHDGCNPTPLETGTYVHPGPDGLWVAEGDTITLRRRDRVLGELPSGDVRFR